MASLYLSAESDGGKRLALKPLTRRAAEAMDPPLTDIAGYFLVESDDNGASVLARIETEDAAIKLGRMLGLS